MLRPMKPLLTLPPDGQPRCAWCAAAAGDAGYLRYHDEEWGRPVGDEFRLFEKLCLEGFQSGLSWRTILNKREAFRAAFAGFDYRLVAGFGEADVQRLLADAGIVRHRGKIEAAIHNARRCVELVAETGSLAAYLWRFEPAPNSVAHNLATSPASEALSKDLKARGWKFVGPTTLHALMQAMGLINDHAPGCVTWAAAQAARDAFKRPG
jgi:DNA-3-methyladenine glycosylase I